MKLLLWFGGILFVLGAVFLLCAGVIRVEKNHHSENYDERQKQAMGKAYRISFYASFCYYIGLMFVIDYLGSIKTVSMLLFIGIVIQLMVFNIYCLLAHAALPLSDRGKPWRSVWCYGVMCAVNLAYFVADINESGAEVSGNALRNLILAAAFAALALMHLIQYLRDRKECNG